MITVTRAVLLPALADAVRAVERRNTIPILSNVLLSASAGRLTITATDLDLEVRTGAPCEGEAKPFTLPATLLHDAVRKMPEVSNITIEADEKTATIATGRSRFRLPVLPSSDFPTLDAGEMAATFTLAPEDLAKMLARVRFAISTEEARYYLNGIYWHALDDRLVAVATDGHRLAKLTLPLPEGAADMPGIILPRRTVEMLKRFADSKEGIAVEISKSKVRFTGDGVTLTSKLIDGTFPDYQRVIPAFSTNRVTLKRKPLAEAIDRVSAILIGSATGRAVKFTFEEELKVSARNPDTGEAEDMVACEAREGEPPETGFNARYCLDMLDVCPSEALTLHMNAAGDPVRVEPEGAPDTLFVILPMRV